MSNVRDFGAAGDGQRDDAEAIEHALRDGDGVLEFPPGLYRISRTIEIPLAERGPTAIHGSGGTARLIMAGPGPALSLVATHTTTADPAGFRPEEWLRERMPTVSALEIVGDHPRADGLLISGVMQPTLSGVLIRQVQTAVHVQGRARNLLITGCHFYHNGGIGVHLDRVNLHQANIIGSHISYCRRGGIRIEGSEIRNLQITGNDIEYNNHKSFPGAEAEPTAEVYVDSREGSVREGTLSGNTIQATYSPGGANVRLIGNSPEANHKVGLWTISGNLIGSQEYNIHLTSARGVTITGNVLYSGHNRNLFIEHCRNVVVGSNVFDHNPDYDRQELCTGIRLEASVDCALQGLVIQDCQSGRHTVKEAGPQARQGLVELVRCRRINVSGTQILEGAPCGLFVDDCQDTLITGCTILDARTPPLMEAAIRWQGSGAGNLISACRVGSGSAGSILAPQGVRQWNNLPG
ncbi:MAG: right-handed parallel beta-helix repeat-containing protein [Planctomycetales bacterium]